MVAFFSRPQCVHVLVLYVISNVLKMFLTPASVHRAVIPPYILGRIYFDNPQVEATGTRKHYLDAKQGKYGFE